MDGYEVLNGKTSVTTLRIKPERTTKERVVLNPFSAPKVKKKSANNSQH